MLPDSNSQVAILCKEVLARGGSFEEMEHDLAYIAVQDKYGFNEIAPIRNPYMPPSLRAYQSMNMTEKNAFLQQVRDFFMINGEAGKYYGEVSFAKNKTRANLVWLKRMKSIFTKDGDVSMAQKVQNRIYEFDSENISPAELAGASSGGSSWRE